MGVNSGYSGSLSFARAFKDKLFSMVVVSGGGLVVLSISLIFVFLLFVVLPLFFQASVHPAHSWAFPQHKAHAPPPLIELNEGAGILARWDLDGMVAFHDVRDGSIVARHVVAGESPFVDAGRDGGLYWYATADGELILLEREWKVDYQEGVKSIIPIVRELGQFNIELRPGQLLKRVRFAADQERSAGVLAAIVEGEEGGMELVIDRYAAENSLFEEEGESEWVLGSSVREPLDMQAQYLLVDPGMKYVYVADRTARLLQYDIEGDGSLDFVRRYALLEGEELSSLEFLLGGISLLVGGAQGSIVQWSLLRDHEFGESVFRRVRAFELQGAVALLSSEERRKGFTALSEEGWLGVYHTTAGNRLIHERHFGARAVSLALSPRSDALFVLTDDGQGHFMAVDNPHPEISWRALWGKVQYESYAKPEYVWQSTAATNDFEPKFSLMPLSYGTLKATFYAVLFAIPISIASAIYVAYFMSMRMRRWIKPIVEIMEALPTVILGFLAGLWLAPYAERNLLGVMLLFIALPLATIGLSWVISRFFPYASAVLDKGWHAMALIPFLLVVAAATIESGILLDSLLFDKGIIDWLNNDLDMNFSQRNSLIIGIAMGFAVIPTIFSISEDAIYGVPDHLVRGSLALGATPWQTLLKVVLLNASPGIFSAVMVGFGRVVGETMIVLMATGNTPVMDMNIFHGMRTLSANIAVELPESENGSTHFRMLYLAALALFAFTFILNTVSELIRHRMRECYGKL
ncbi:MAG: ABC transporter permease subunit [Candidatus Eutrophobiaceae bacterium]